MKKLAGVFEFLIFSSIILTATAHVPLQLQKRPSLSAAFNFDNVFELAAKVQLPTTVSPEHYTLHIRPILEDPPSGETPFTAPGSIQIIINCHEETSQVTLHKDPALVIDTASIFLFALAEDGSHGSQVEVTETSYDQPNVFYTFHLATVLQAGGRYELSMNFLAEVNSGQNGLYRAQYETPSGDVTHMATTQFESTGARKAFPCFDEPGWKSTYDINIARQTHRNSLSNTVPLQAGVVDPALPEGWVWDRYNRTVPMPSYLVAIIVSDFVCVEADSSIFDGRPVRVCGPSYQIVDYNAGLFPATVAARTMKYLEETFKFPYEMFKLDNAAIPRTYFGPGAMENWGLVTYRDNYLLHYENQSTQGDESFIWSIVFHELGHQWFGNIVTCKTWGNLWLNEGFATYVSYLMHHVVPHFDAEREMLFDAVQNAMAYDVGRDEPIFNEDRRSGSTIIYDKGGSVIRMMEGFLGRQVLFEALIEYIRLHAYQPAEQDQLFAVLNEFAHEAGKIPSDLTMKQIMDTWTLQAGYPLLRVSKVDSGNVHISQETFLSVETEEKALKDNLWEVPIAIARANNPDFSNHTPALWLTNNSTGETIQHDTTSWIVLNPDAMGYYRVLYDDDLLALIHNQLAANVDNLSPLSRSQLIDDYFTFAFLGHEPIEKALELTKYLDNDDDNVVWNTVFLNSDKTRRMFENRPELSDYLLPKLNMVLQRFAVYTTPLNELGSGTKIIFVASLLDWACGFEGVLCRQLALNLYNQWMAQPDRLTELIPPDFEAILLCHGVAQSGQEGYDFINDQYLKADPFGLHKGRFLQALICGQNSNLQVLLKNLFNVDYITESNAALVLEKMAKDSKSRSLVVQFIGQNVHKINAYFGQETLTLIVSTLSDYYNTPKDLTEFGAFINKLKPYLASQEVTLNESLEKVKANIKWMSDFGNSISSWLASSKI